MNGLADDEVRIRAAGLRVTAGRRAVLRVARELPHATADVIADAVRQRIGSISTQGIYDALHSLTDAGLLRRIRPAGSPTRYEARVADNHHHLICRGCGEVCDVDCAVGDVPCLTPDTDHGYLVDEAEVIYWGHCPDCRLAAEGSGSVVQADQPSR